MEYDLSMPTVWANKSSEGLFLSKKTKKRGETMAEGRIFKIESMGLVDGPGIRMVIFFQGCPLRCKFCHNPESHSFTGGQTISTEELMKKILRFKPYFDRSGGGVTFSGGEPLAQDVFLLEILKACKRENIHTCLDTSGVGKGNYKEILSLCDMVLYDVKATDNNAYKKICGRDIKETEDFLKALDESNSKIIVRQVVIPDINDNDEYMSNLKKYIKEKIPRTSKVELLPYHKLGEHKYKELGLISPLAETSPMDKGRAEKLWEKHFKNMEDK